MRQAINGILLLDKPVDISSNGALQRAKRLYNARKAGHTGSLDPIATGMLPLCFGEATKFSQFLLESNKSYHVIAKLGERTKTGDTEGEVVETLPTTGITLTRIKEVATSFLGEIFQIPPMFSAVKLQGKPLYELARAGIEVEREARRIHIFSIMIENLQDDLLTFSVTCSKGTYIRTLVEDMGKQLGCGAHVQQLRRTSVSPYSSHAMYTLDQLMEISDTKGMDGLLACLLPIETAVTTFPTIVLSSTLSYYLMMGQPVRTTIQHTTSPFVRLLSEDESFLGLGMVMPDGRIKPHRLVSKSG